VQRAPDLAPGERAVGFGGAGPRARGIQRADGVQSRIVFRDAGEVELDELRGTETARTDSPGKLGGAGERVDALV
jgi:hypothetical protein